jgi:hypothetical protein
VRNLAIRGAGFDLILWPQAGGSLLFGIRRHTAGAIRVAGQAVEQAGPAARWVGTWDTGYSVLFE